MFIVTHLHYLNKNKLNSLEYVEREHVEVHHNTTNKSNINQNRLKDPQGPTYSAIMAAFVHKISLHISGESSTCHLSRSS